MSLASRTGSTSSRGLADLTPPRHRRPKLVITGSDGADTSTLNLKSGVPANAAWTFPGVEIRVIAKKGDDTITLAGVDGRLVATLYLFGVGEVDLDGAAGPDDEVEHPEYGDFVRDLSGLFGGSDAVIVSGDSDLGGGSFYSVSTRFTLKAGVTLTSIVDPDNYDETAP
jgi:hypothetical protein